jgi:uncharacterized membrane protein HdeD (DUF308 family)
MSEQSPPAAPPPAGERGGGLGEPLPFGRRRSALVLGIVVGVLCIGGIVLVGITPLSVGSGSWVVIVAPVAYLATAVVLAVRPRTTLLGAGLLIAIGISVLISGGVCVALAAGLGRSTSPGPPK